MRYMASTLRGCLVETLARFRPSPVAEAVLADVEGVEPDDIDHDREQGLQDWLVQQKVGRCSLELPAPLLLDIDAADVLVEFDKHPSVRTALDTSNLGTPLAPARLDAGIIRLTGPVGRPITQAVSRAIREWRPDVHGLAYWSRLDSTERCWAVYDHVPVTVSVTPLDPSVKGHRAAVREVAALLEILLPVQWQ